MVEMNQPVTKGPNLNRSEHLKTYWQEVREGKRPQPKRGERSGEIRRRMRCHHNWLKSGEVILTIYPHGEMGFREPHTRAEYKLSLTEAFRSAVVLTTNLIAAKVKELRKSGHTLAQARKLARKSIL